MATTYDIRRRRDDFCNLSFDEMIEKIMDLETALEDMTGERDDLTKELEDALNA